MTARLAGIARVSVWVLLAAGLAPAVSAQPIGSASRIDFDRPESWAMKYFVSVGLLAATPAPQGGAGSVSFGGELVALPGLTTAQQRVGFNGTAQENLNLAPFFARPRVTVGLPARLAVTVAGVPPVHLFSITPRLLSLGIDRTLVRSPAWTWTARLHGQLGSVTGAITCPPGVVAQAPGSDANRRGCDSLSSDRASLRYLAAELDATRRIGASSPLALRGSFALTYMDTVFQTNAHTFGFLDRTRLATRGMTTALGADVLWQAGARTSLGLGLLFAPLRIERPGSAGRTFDSLLTARAILVYRLR